MKFQGREHTWAHSNINVPQGHAWKVKAQMRLSTQSDQAQALECPNIKTMKQFFLRNGLLSVFIFDIVIYLRTELQAPVDQGLHFLLP